MDVSQWMSMLANEGLLVNIGSVPNKGFTATVSTVETPYIMGRCQVAVNPYAALARAEHEFRMAKGKRLQDAKHSNKTFGSRTTARHSVTAEVKKVASAAQAPKPKGVVATKE